jgi:hypothetical protein
MPLNEARGFNTRKQLTAEQRYEAHAQILGLDTRNTMEQELNLTPEQIEGMRSFLARHDARNRGKEFDLNNPPKEPYRHQEYPTLVYNHRKRTHKLVHNDKELKTALDAGWRKDPPTEEPEDHEPLPVEEATPAKVEPKADPKPADKK